LSTTLLRYLQEEEPGPETAASADGRLQGSVKALLKEVEILRLCRESQINNSRAEALLISNARVEEWLAQTEAFEETSHPKCACVCL